MQDNRTSHDQGNNSLQQMLAGAFSRDLERQQATLDKLEEDFVEQRIITSKSVDKLRDIEVWKGEMNSAMTPTQFASIQGDILELRRDVEDFKRTYKIIQAILTVAILILTSGLIQIKCIEQSYEPTPQYIHQGERP